MAKVEKILEKMESSPSSISFDDAKKVLEWMGYTAKNPKRGSHIAFKKDGVNPVIVKRCNPVKTYTVKEILKLAEE